MTNHHRRHVTGHLDTVATMSLDLPKFVSLEYVMDELSISKSQAYALVRPGQLRAIQVGGRDQWRVPLDELEAYLVRSYAATARDVGSAVVLPS